MRWMRPEQTAEHEAMLDGNVDGATAAPRRARWICWCATARRSAPSGWSRPTMSPAPSSSSTPSVRDFAKKGFDAVYSELNLDSRGSGRDAEDGGHTCQLITGIDNEQLARQGIPDDLAEQQKRGEEFFGSARHQHVRDLHALSGRQCAGEGRALRLDGILRRRLLQFRARRAHQYRRARKAPARQRSPAAFRIGAIICPENRRGTASCATCDVDVDDIMDWGLLGYYLGEIIEDEIPVLDRLASTSRA